MYNTFCRSFLARSSRPIISHLSTAARRHGCGGSSRSTPLVGNGANGALSRGYCWSDWSCDEFGIDDYSDSYPADEAAADVAGKTPSSGHPNPWRRPHMYVIVDDWRWGFSLHKLDLLGDTDLVSRPQANQTTYHHLPPPAMRLWFSNIGTSTTFAAVGSKILACSSGQDGLTIIYDTGTAGQAIVHCSPNVLDRAYCQAAVGVGNTLYAMGCSFDLRGTRDNRVKKTLQRLAAQKFQVLACVFELLPAVIAGVVADTGELHFLDGAVSDFDRAKDNKLSWSRCPSQLPFKLEFAYGRVASYAVHPDGKTIFTSVTGDSNHPVGTYSYDTEIREWSHQGTWMLPFSWQGCYDDELDAWVGHYDDSGIAKIGCCDIPSLGVGGSIPPPNWKRCDDDVISGLMCLDAKLVSVGGGWFCFLESGPREGVDIRSCKGEGDKCELRVTTFRARYGKNGELRIVDRRLARSYVLSRYATGGFKMKAFWM
ncbi:unnamed protein product [Urochloa decumbens]|uniref:Uncharacterized protein n=1 Tax=Urochloa decumbens TaxID=240449 RepID=A0ABC9BYN2_9POAL